MSVQMQQTRDTAANWTSVNPVLAQGQFGLETDTGKLKVGDGSTAWTSLAYWSAGSLSNPMASAGDLIIGGTAGAATRLAGNTTTARQFLTSQGTGSAAQAETWGALQAGDVPAATSSAEGIVQLAGDLGGTASSPQVTGTHLASPLPIAQGGTGTATGAGQNTVLAGPATGGAGAPSFRGLAASDVPQLADYAPTGLTGATAASRYVGATASGAPASGTFAVGDFAVDQTGRLWLCTSAGSPGTWVFLVPSTGAAMNGPLSPKVTAIGTTSGTITPDASLGNVATLTLSGNATINVPANGVNRELFELDLVAGGHTVTWGSGWNWGAAGTPSLSASAMDIIVARYRSSVPDWCAAVSLGY